MGAAEWIATTLGLACVALAAIRSIWTFPVGIAGVSVLGVVVFEARLYSDALLQVFFVAANIYGWLAWSRSAADRGAVVVGTLTPRQRLVWMIGIALATAAWGTIMHRLTDAALPWWDAGIAAASVAAQILMAQRRIENWWLWIAVDLASIPLYLVRGLELFAMLYLLYLLLAIWALLAWRRAEEVA